MTTTKMMPPLLTETYNKARRQFLKRSGSATLSSGAIVLLSGCGVNAIAKTTESGSDVRVLNTAISAEYEAIAAYQVGAESGLLEKSVLDVAVKFQGHHKEHVELLSKAVASLGGTASSAKESYDFPVEKLKSQADVLAFAAGLERGAVSAYAGAVPVFENRDLAKAAASILSDEAMHWAILRNALGLDPVPGAFFS